MNLVDLVKEDFGISGSGRWFRSDVHSSLVVDSENNRFYFNSRDLSGGVVDYLIGVRGISRKVAEEMSRYDTAKLPEYLVDTGLQVKFEKLVDLFHSAGRDDRQYWYDRKLTDSTIDRYRLGNYDGWSLIPIYDEGRFINFQCRKDKPDKRITLWYKDKDFIPVLYNKDVLSFVKEAYIVEGMVDCILLNQLGFPSICSTNGAMTWNQGWIKYFSKIDSIYYIADNDKAGIASAKSVSNSLGSSRTKILRFKDKKEKYGVKDFFVEGGTVEEFRKLLTENSVYGFEKELI